MKTGAKLVISEAGCYWYPLFSAFPLLAELNLQIEMHLLAYLVITCAKCLLCVLFGESGGKENIYNQCMNGLWRWSYLFVCG